jgi:hypothetical protein
MALRATSEDEKLNPDEKGLKATRLGDEERRPPEAYFSRADAEYLIQNKYQPEHPDREYEASSVQNGIGMILVMEAELEPISQLGAAISPRDCAVSVHAPLDVHSPFRGAPEPLRQRH